MGDRDCVFLLADNQMEHTFKGFLSRDNAYLRLGTRQFTCDFIVDRQNGDSGVHKRAHEFLRLYTRTHKHAIVVLDDEWGGSPGQARIQSDIKENLTSNGWSEEQIEVVVIEPELDIWLWQENTSHIVEAFGHFDHQPHPTLRKWLEQKGYWLATDLKPARPKDAFELLQKVSGISRSGAIYSKIASKMSVKSCKDKSFCLLRETLQRWFPADGGQQ